jgi:hypothetical protein
MSKPSTYQKFGDACHRRAVGAGRSRRRGGMSNDYRKQSGDKHD